MEDRDKGMLRVAAMDIGTVTTRLLIADTDGVSVEPVVRRSVVTHLGEGLHASGRVSEAAIGRVADAVRGFVEEAGSRGCDVVSIVATSAARDATNGAAFIRRVAEAGAEPRIIAGDMEARLSFSGATHGMEGDGILIADLGGGSTELVYGSARSDACGHSVGIVASRSFDVGSRRVTDMFLRADPPTAGEIDAAARWVRAQFSPFFEALPAPPETLMTLAGTGTTLVAVRERMAVYDPERVHLSTLSYGDVSRLRARFASMTEDSRRSIIGMEPARAGVIVAGAVILEVIVDLAGTGSTVVSENDLLHGIVLEAWERARVDGRSSPGVSSPCR